MRVDYDKIAHLYDLNPLRKKRVDRHLEEYLQALTGRSLSEVSAVDIACGTGNQAIANKAMYPQVEMWGVDRSEQMLNRARRKSRDVTWVQADMDHVGLHLGAFDYASCQFAYHHFRDKRRFMLNAYDNLRRGGWLTVTNLDAVKGLITVEYATELIVGRLNRRANALHTDEDSTARPS